MITESSLIETIKSLLPKANSNDIGIGDDCALVHVPNEFQLMTTDMLIEGIHFDFSLHRPFSVGRKCLNVNVSDVAAMGGTPTHALLSLAIPKNFCHQILGEFLNGFCDALAEYKIALVGGDTNATHGPFVASITLCGTPHPRGVVLRSGAIAGNIIAVTGTLGDSLATAKHLNFNPRLSEASSILDAVGIHAMMDLSDGLAADLPKLCAASKVGASIDFDTLPISSTLLAAMRREEAVMRALGDGEDFELLLCLSNSDFAKAQSVCPGLTAIGVITADKNIVGMQHGKPVRFPNTGYEHRF